MNFAIKINKVMIVVGILLTFNHIAAAHETGLDSELKRLDNVINNVSGIETPRQKSIDSLKSLLQRDRMSTSGRAELCVRLSEVYRQVNADSSMKYARRGMEYGEASGDTTLVLRNKIALFGALATAGMFKNSSAIYDSISGLKIPIIIKTELWKAARQMYSNMLLYVGNEQPYYAEYRNKYMAIDDSLVKYLPESDLLRRFIVGERMVWMRDYRQAQLHLESLMKEVGENSNYYGMAAYQMAEICRSQGNIEKYADYLVKASVSDIMCGVKEGVALSALAEYLYENGMVDDAFRYINFALEDAMSGNARMRALSTARLLPLIDSSYRREIAVSHSRLVVYGTFITVLMLICLFLLVMTYKQVRKVRAGERKLASQAKIQDSYIGSLLQMCATYSDRLDQQANMVSRKIKTGRIDELQKLVESGRLSEAQNEEFYRVVDKAILDIYPHFIESVNSLLRPEEKIELIEDNVLTPELRIYAFVRFGVEESTKIARILHYSVSTVYTYRNRMRNKAIDRADFDRAVREI